jgi:hypothetical protein
MWKEATGGDSPFEPQAGFSSRGDLGDYAGGAGQPYSGEDDGLHLRLYGQPDAGSSSRPDKGIVGMNLATLI